MVKKKHFIFLMKSLKRKKKKLALTSFGQVNWELKKAQLDRPIKILLFLKPVRIQKYLI